MSLRDRVGKYVPAVRSQAPLSREEMLKVTPIRNPNVTWEKIEGGEIALRIPRRKDYIGSILGRIFHIPSHKEILLDEVGASVWELCDARNDIRRVIAETSDRYKLNIREAEVSVTTYIRMLAERRLIGLVQRGGKPPHGRR